MPEKLKNVSKVPKITPELLEENEEQQRTWRERFILPLSTPTSYAKTVINSNLDILDSLERQIKTAKRRKEKADLKEKFQQISEVTAVWADSIGNFHLALALSSDKHQRRLFRERIKAVVRPDDEWCKHPIFEHINGQLAQVAAREMDFFSQKHGRILSMIRCRHCGFRNAKDLPTELRKLSEHRAEAVKTGMDSPKPLAEIVEV